MPALFSSRRSQLAALIALWAFSSFLCSYYLFASGSLYLDHLGTAGPAAAPLGVGASLVLAGLIHAGVTRAALVDVRGAQR
jgi:hypothetical protein